MKPAVVVEGVYKKYSRNSQKHLNYGASDLMREIMGKSSSLKLRKDEFYAVNDASFHLAAGESFALVGRNGSGKTTLLMMMSGLIKPDAGTVHMRGRIQALINLGAGFNPALSGRENIYTAAALVGMRRDDIKRLEDEIVGFAELDDFIDSPVRTYSKGMYARLGFSVAVHLNPEILLVDEILAVGDYSFRNKCHVKIHELRKSGVTIVLVSHSRNDVVQLCQRALWIHRGEVKMIGESKEVSDAYSNFVDEEELARSKLLWDMRKDDRKKAAKKREKKETQDVYGPIYNDCDVVDNLKVAFLVDGREVDTINVHDAVKIRFSFRIKSRITDLNVSLVFFRKDGLRLTTISTLNGDLLKKIHSGAIECEVDIEDFHFNPGSYALIMPIHEGKSYLYRDVVKEFGVVSKGRMTWQLTDMKYEYTVRKTAE